MQSFRCYASEAIVQPRRFRQMQIQMQRFRCKASGAIIQRQQFRCGNSNAKFRCKIQMQMLASTIIQMQSFKSGDSDAAVQMPNFRCYSSEAAVQMRRFRCKFPSRIQMRQFRCESKWRCVQMLIPSAAPLQIHRFRNEALPCSVT